MAVCPFAHWRPLGSGHPDPMTRHDLVILHTMGGGSLASTDRNFHVNGYGGLESHFGVGADGTIYQWVDTAYVADANLDANPRAISIETADSGTAYPSWKGSDVPAWNAAQLAAIVRLVRWICDVHRIPKATVPDSRSSRRGIAGHRQGVDSSPAGQAGYRKPGGEHWSTVLGKVCPGDRRYAQIRSVIVPAVAKPVPQPITTPISGDDEMRTRMVYDAGAPTPRPVYASNGITRRWVVDGADEAQLVASMTQDGYPSWYKVPHAIPAGTLDRWGVLVGPDYTPPA